MVSKTYRIAVIGVGAIANLHGQSIDDLDHAQLVACSCRTEEKGRQYTDRFGGNWYQDYEKMLDTEKPDLVTLCTPSGVHLDPTLACAQRGIHVLCEKPMEITTQRIDQMIDAAQQGNIMLGGVFPQRYNPVVIEVKKAAESGRFGDLAAVNSYVPWWRDDDYYAPNRWQGTLQFDGGGAMMNQSIHGVDMVQWIAAAAMEELDPSDNPVEEVFAYTAKRSHDPELIEVEDTATAIMRFKNGALGQLLGSTAMYPGSLKRFQMAGRDGTAEILEDELITFKFREEQNTDQALRDQFGQQTKTGGGASDPMAIDYTLHKRNIAAFLNTLDHESPFMLNAVEARKSVAIVEAIYKSAKSGQPVKPQ